MKSDEGTRPQRGMRALPWRGIQRRLGRLSGDAAVVAYANWLIRWRWAVIAVALVAAITAAIGVGSLGFSTNYRVFFSDENPQLQAFEAV